MNQGRAIIVGPVALMVGFGAGFVLRPAVAPTRQTMAAAGPAAANPPER